MIEKPKIKLVFKNKNAPPSREQTPNSKTSLGQIQANTSVAEEDTVESPLKGPEDDKPNANVATEKKQAATPKAKEGNAVISATKKIPAPNAEETMAATPSTKKTTALDPTKQQAPMSSTKKPATPATARAQAQPTTRSTEKAATLAATTDWNGTLIQPKTPGNKRGPRGPYRKTREKQEREAQERLAKLAETEEEEAVTAETEAVETPTLTPAPVPTKASKKKWQK